MALKSKISKADYEKLHDVLKKEYVEKDGEYFLDTEDSDELRRAKDREKAKREDAEKEAKEARAALREAEDKLADLDKDGKRKSGKIDELEAAWKTENEKVKSTALAEKTKLHEFIQKELLDKTAGEIAARISTAPAVILPHIKGRMRMEFDGDAPVLRVLDKEGKISALTSAELEKEFVDNKDFAAIIVASKASGNSNGKQPGGRAPGDNGGGSVDKQPDLRNPNTMLAHLESKLGGGSGHQRN